MLPLAYARGKNASMRPSPSPLNRGRGMKPWTPALNVPPPGTVSIEARDPSTPLNVAAIGSRSTAIPFTLSSGKSREVVPVTGSVTSKPSIHSEDSCGLVPPMTS